MTLDDCCARARGEAGIPGSEIGIEIIGASQYIACSGRIHHRWYRMVWRDGAWIYIAKRLPFFAARAAERHAETTGDVWPGEVVVEHDWRRPLSGAFVVDGAGDLVACGFARRRDGDLRITLPDETEITLPDPRKRA